MHDICLLTEHEAAAQLRVAPRTLARWRSTGAGPRFRRIGPRQIRYSAEDLRAWLVGRGFDSRAAEYVSRTRPNQHVDATR